MTCRARTARDMACASSAFAPADARDRPRARRGVRAASRGSEDAADLVAADAQCAADEMTPPAGAGGARDECACGRLVDERVGILARVHEVLDDGVRDALLRGVAHAIAA